MLTWRYLLSLSMPSAVFFFHSTNWAPSDRPSKRARSFGTLSEKALERPTDSKVLTVVVGKAERPFNSAVPMEPSRMVTTTAETQRRYKQSVTFKFCWACCKFAKYISFDIFLYHLCMKWVLLSVTHILISKQLTKGVDFRQSVSQSVSPSVTLFENWFSHQNCQLSILPLTLGHPVNLQWPLTLGHPVCLLWPLTLGHPVFL